MGRQDAPAPLRRRGPRPLWLHLMQPSPDWKLVLQRLSAQAQTAGLPLPNLAHPNLAHPNLAHPGLAHPGLTPDPALLAGIAAYRRHPYHRTIEDPPVIWREGSTRLLDYGPPGAPPLLVVPSLVNRAYVLDLLPGHSMLRFLAAGGVRPLLLDWGYPDDAERAFTLSDYIAGRLERAMASIGGPLTLVGYCMGGLMAVAAAQRRPDLVRRLVLLATPWDFWAASARQAQDLAALLPLLEPMMAESGTLGIDGLQTLFSLLDPGAVGEKYRDFAGQDQASARARMFVAMEDWLNDGIPLAAPVARETLAGWYGRNTPMEGEWRVLGMPVRPERLDMACFVATPARDRIVPPESARALGLAIAGATIHTPRAGHVGMIAGSGARAQLWEVLLDWLGK
jgi:poly(3-hydroxyalkanoate) synthetase